MFPEICYLLGYFWADGYLPKKYNGIVLEINTTDALSIKETILKTGDWTIVERGLDNRKDAKRKGNTFIRGSDKEFKDFLLEHDYKNKSQVSFKKIYELIPTENKKYFLRGYFDGDGCIYISNSTIQFHVSSTIDQDWSVLEEIFKKLSISYKITKRVQNSNSRSSKIQCTNTEDILKLLSYVYDNFEVDKIGLDRKYQKYLQIVNRPIKQFKKKMTETLRLRKLLQTVN